MIATACQRWTDRRPSWRPVSAGGFDRRRYDWSLLEERAARPFVERHHYAGSWPAAKLSIGMWQADRLVGVAVIGVPVRAEVLSNPFPGLRPYEQSAELARLVLLDEVPANGESWLVARVLDHLRRSTPIRGVLSFADPHPRQVGDLLVKPGHIGTVYQACAARYLGRGRARWITLLPDGTVLNDRAAAKVVSGEQGWRYVRDRLVALGAPPTGTPDRMWLDEALAAVGARRERHGGNHRYAIPLHRAVRIGLPEQPYPKAGPT